MQAGVVPISQSGGGGNLKVRATHARWPCPAPNGTSAVGSFLEGQQAAGFCGTWVVAFTAIRGSKSFGGGATLARLLKNLASCPPPGTPPLSAGAFPAAVREGCDSLPPSAQHPPSLVPGEGRAGPQARGAGAQRRGARPPGREKHRAPPPHRRVPRSALRRATAGISGRLRPSSPGVASEPWQRTLRRTPVA